MPNVAIVVGIQDYPGLDGDKLKGPVEDAKEFAGWLKKHKLADRIALITSGVKPSKDGKKAKPPYEQIKDVFKELVDDFERAIANGESRLGERLFIYLSGHGFEPDGAEPALLAADASETEMTHIAGRLFADYFRKGGFFDEIILVMDTCREDKGQHPVFDVKFKKFVNLAAEPRWFYAYATKSNRLAREKKVKTKARGVFTVALLEGLEKAAMANGTVTDQSVELYVHDKLKTVDQKPVFDFDRDPDPDRRVVFRRDTGTEGWTTVTVKFSRPFLGKRFAIVGKHFRRFHEGKAAAELAVKLPVGRFMIMIDGEPQGDSFAVPPTTKVEVKGG